MVRFNGQMILIIAHYLAFEMSIKLAKFYIDFTTNLQIFLDKWYIITVQCYLCTYNVPILFGAER